MPHVTRRDLFAGLATAALYSRFGGRKAFAATADELAQAPVAELVRLLDSAAETARSLAEKCVERIERIDRAGPTLRSVIELNPDLLAEADRLDRERREGNRRGPLHGVPVLLKDNLDTGDRMLTTAGSLALEAVPAAKDSGAAAALRRAGLLLLGKTNLSEWANFRSSDSTSGWSGRGGLTRNPYCLDRNACGSSSGSAVAVAAGLAPLALGTETSGSILCPSSINGIVGLKPSVGVVPGDGVVPIASSFDCVGPMARSVEDAALLFQALAPAAGVDSAALDRAALRGARIGIARDFFGQSAEVDALIEEALGAMRAAGAELIDVEGLPGSEQFGRAPFEVMLFEFRDGLDRYLATRPDLPVKTLEDVIAFNERNRDRELPYFGQDILERAAEKGPLDSAEYRQALETTRRLSRDEGIDRALERDRLDALLAPSNLPAWVTDLVRGDPSSGGSSAALPARAGYPSLTVPAGYIHGLPIGVTLFSGHGREGRLLNLGYAFEQETRVRRPPEFLPTIGASAAVHTVSRPGA